jgi:transcriptional regulator GlxA family with amidase domain
MKIAILTFEGFNELDSFIALGIINRLHNRGWRAEVVSPSPKVTSLNGVTIHSQQNLEFSESADVVLFGSGSKTREISEDQDTLNRLRLDPTRQLIGAQCSGTLLMAKLGLIGTLPACTDLTTKPWVQAAGIQVIDAPFYSKGNLATAGGCMSSQYLAAWVIAKLAGEEAAEQAIHYVAPVGQKSDYVARVMEVIVPFI